MHVTANIAIYPEIAKRIVRRDETKHDFVFADSLCRFMRFDNIRDWDAYADGNVYFNH